MSFAAGNFHDAEISLQLAMKEAESKQLHASCRLDSYYYLACTYGRLNKMEEAEVLARKALTLYQEMVRDAPAEQQLKWKKSEGNYTSLLAQMYMRGRKYDDARLLYEQALALDEQNGCAMSLAVGQRLSSLADVEALQERFEAAEALYKKALVINETIFGPTHHELYLVLHNIAFVCSKQGRYDEAEALYKRSLAILQNDRQRIADELKKRRLGYGSHISTLATLSRVFSGKKDPAYAAASLGLADMYSATGRMDEAEKLYRQVMEVQTKELGDHHPELARSLERMGKHLTKCGGREAEGASLLARAKAIKALRK